MQTTSASGTAVTFAPTAIDAYDGAVPVTCTPASGSTFAVGTTKVSCTATNAGGYSASGTFDVTVERIAPVDGGVAGPCRRRSASRSARRRASARSSRASRRSTRRRTGATVISTAGDAALTVSDPGHLANGAFTLPEPLRVELSRASWTAPVANDPVTITFRQRVKATDPLRTGSYSRTLTFTLSTTTP